jgi:hypothetical protein
MSDTTDMVVFEMADGTPVSNDPRFGLEEALQAQLEATEYHGDAGIPPDEFEAQHQVTHVASMNSGQPGVGENATPDDPVKDAYGPLGSPAQQKQVEDTQKAAELGATPFSTAVEDPEPVDSNEAVLAAREAKAKAAAAYRKAQEKLAAAEEGEGEGEPSTDWTGNQLKAEIAKRNADGRSEENYLSVKKGMKKADVVAMLKADAENTPSADSSGDEDDNEDDDSSNDSSNDES